jgi:hypothetical protein
MARARSPRRALLATLTYRHREVLATRLADDGLAAAVVDAAPDVVARVGVAPAVIPR